MTDVLVYRAKPYKTERTKWETIDFVRGDKEKEDSVFEVVDQWWFNGSHGMPFALDSEESVQFFLSSLKKDVRMYPLKFEKAPRERLRVLLMDANGHNPREYLVAPYVTGSVTVEREGEEESFPMQRELAELERLHRLTPEQRARAHAFRETEREEMREYAIRRSEQVRGEVDRIYDRALTYFREQYQKAKRDALNPAYVITPADRYNRLRLFMLASGQQALDHLRRTERFAEDTLAAISGMFRTAILYFLGRGARALEKRYPGAYMAVDWRTVPFPYDEDSDDEEGSGEKEDEPGKVPVSPPRTMRPSKVETPTPKKRLLPPPPRQEGSEEEKARPKQLPPPPGLEEEEEEHPAFSKRGRKTVGPGSPESGATGIDADMTEAAIDADTADAVIAAKMPPSDMIAYMASIATDARILVADLIASLKSPEEKKEEEKSSILAPIACDACGMHKTDLMRCARCKRAHYCSKECQIGAWSTHRHTCHCHD